MLIAFDASRTAAAVFYTELEADEAHLLWKLATKRQAHTNPTPEND